MATDSPPAPLVEQSPASSSSELHQPPPPAQLCPPELVKLNIGGYKYETTLETLTKRGPNMLSKMLEERRNRDANLYHFFDRDGQYFAVLLEYLRHGSLVIPPGFARSSIEREAACFEIALPASMVQPPSPPVLRTDGIYITKVTKVVPGFFLFGPESRFFHQTTNPVHNYIRMFSVNTCVVQWTLGGLANEEQHALLSATGALIAECNYSFIPFAEAPHGMPLRLRYRSCALTCSSLPRGYVSDSEQ